MRNGRLLPPEPPPRGDEKRESRSLPSPKGPPDGPIGALESSETPGSLPPPEVAKFADLAGSCSASNGIGTRSCSPEETPARAEPGA